MKKFTNNALWGVISMILNLVILCMVIVSAVQLGSYDKKNIYLQDSIMPSYSFWMDSVKYSEEALGKKQNSLEGYTKLFEDTKVSAEKVRQSLAENPEDDSLKNKYYSDTTHLNDYGENITRLNTEVSLYKDTVRFAKAGLKPWAAKHDAAVKEASPTLGGFNVVIIITSILLVIKMICFGFWMMLNTRNVRRVAPWWKKNSDVMNIIAWFIPIYNLFKPCALFSNLISETKYVLRDKSIITDAKDANHMESISLWWGSMIFAKMIMPLFIGGLTLCLNVWLFTLVGVADMDVAANSLGLLGFGTYFGNTGLFYYLRPHTIVMAFYLIGWIVYLGYECYMIFKYNKLNKMMCDNEDKFTFEEPAAEK
jgi:hypothetical protein